MYFFKQKEDGTPYSTKHAFSCLDQLDAFKTLLENMASKADEYITMEGRQTNNTPEGCHGIALTYRDKRIDWGSTHYQCKTIPHKVNALLTCSSIHLQLPDKAVLKILDPYSGYRTCILGMILEYAVEWQDLKNIEELTEGGCAKLFTATLRESTVVVKKFKLNKHLSRSKTKL